MKCLVVDANILCLIVAGNHLPASIGRHKRLRSFELEDFNKILHISSFFDKVFTCSHVLAETSNLISYTNDAEKALLLNGLKEILSSIQELTCDSLLACDHVAYQRLGLTDAVLLTMEVVEGHLLTTDLDLTLAAQHARMPVINYNWVRDSEIESEVW